MKAESIEYVLDRLGGDGSYGRSGNHLMANCVHAEWGHHSGDDRDHKLGVMVQDGMSPLNCFYPGCLPDGARTMLGLVQLVGGKRVGAGYMTADELSNLKSFVLMAEEDDQVATDTAWGAARPKEIIPPSLIEVCSGYAPYWVSRGVSPQTAQEWRLGELGGRALMPFMDRSGTIVAVQGRLMPGYKKDAYAWETKHHDEKYRSFPVGFEREQLLVGEHLIPQPVDVLVVVESPFDAIALTDWIRPDPTECLPRDASWAVVATMGGEVATRQAQKMVEFLAPGGELVLGMDRDHAGMSATRYLIGYDKRFQKHMLYRRVARISEVEWVRKDVTDMGNADEGTTVTPDVARRQALHAIRDREDSLLKYMQKLVA